MFKRNYVKFYFEGIAAYLRVNHPDIDHQQDVWHVQKNFIKKLTNECTTNVSAFVSVKLHHIALIQPGVL